MGATLRAHLPLLLAALLLAASATLLLYRLGSEPFHDYDEATYTEVVAESGPGFPAALSFLNQPFFRKPPLEFWLMDAARLVPASMEFDLRLPSVLAALMTIALVMLIVREAGAGPYTAVLGGAVLATTSAFMEPARQVRFDILVALLIAATFYAFLRAERTRWWYLAAGVLFGLAILGKSVIAVFAIVAVAAYALAARRFSWLADPYFWGGAALALLVAVPWHLLETLRYGAAFWQSYLGTEVVERVRTNLFGARVGTTTGQYLGYLYAFAAPWAFIALPVAATYFYYRRATAPRMRAVAIASFAVIGAVLIVMLASQTKATTYFIPLYPFLAIFIALAVEILAPQGSTSRTLVIAGALACVTLGAAITIYNVLHVNPYFAFETRLARDEAAIGGLVKEAGPDATVYEYAAEDFGAIEYYGRIAFAAHPFVYLLSDSSRLAGVSLVITEGDPAAVIARFPQLRFRVLYRGAFMSLLSVES